MAEWLYLVDSNDNVLGKIERKKAHEEERLHRAGMIFILNKQMKTFIVHRANKETFPNAYDASCTFHVAFGESYEGAAMRELSEELGIKVPVKLIGKFVHHDPPEHQIVDVFVGYSDKIGMIDTREAYSGRWYTDNELHEIVKGSITPWLRDGYKILQRFKAARSDE